MTDLHCAEFVEQVTAFLDGALDPAAERRFVDHLAHCDGCDTYLAQIRTTIQSLGDLPPGDLPPDTRATLLEAFRKLG